MDVQYGMALFDGNKIFRTAATFIISELVLALHRELSIRFLSQPVGGEVENHDNDSSTTVRSERKGLVL